METSPKIALAVALEGAGWHPSAWRLPGARPAELFSGRYWVDLVREADRAGIDFVTIDDSMSVQTRRRGVPDDRIDRVRGRLDAVLIAARAAPATRSLGLVPTATTTHTEPFHVSKAIATLDYVSGGRGGVQVRVSSTALEARQFGRRPVPDAAAGPVGPDQATDLFDEAADFIEVVRRLWDSWEDGAEIRDVDTGRFIDRDRLHYIDFEGRWFSVKGPSITPRPPQGQPLVTALAHVPVAFRLAARQADVVFVTPDGPDDARAIIAGLRTEEAAVGRTLPPLLVFADLVVFLDTEAAAAEERRALLDGLAGRPHRSDAHVFTGTPAGLVDLLVDWETAGIDGFRLRPAAIPHDLEAITRRVVPLARQGGILGRQPRSGTLREHLGLLRPENRYVDA
ncbi:MAG: LLM class flavin-dependent oxidoreductase [Acidimicrobiales bacterium]|jgi:alkanesulfonate monooxygenase SsuD/methylene tetrahydromethanopterin reductase-like flavin-dependent oxidoreductase (luciferase family)